MRSERESADGAFEGVSPSTWKRLARKLLRLTPLRPYLDNGIPPWSPVILPNFLFQRVFGINRACRWPVHYTSVVLAPERITLGRGIVRSFALSPGCYVQAFNGVSFGDDILFGPGVKIVSANHDARDLMRNVAAPPIRIGHRCWIAANAVLLPSVELGDDVVVGAGAVVTKSFPTGVVIGGSPARILRRRCAA